MFVNLIGAHNTAQFGVVWSCCTGSFTGDYTGHLTRTTKNHLGCISFPTNHNIQVQASFLLGQLLQIPSMQTAYINYIYTAYTVYMCIYILYILYIYIYGDDSIQSCMRSLLSQHRVHYACFSPQMVYGSIGIHPSVTLSTTSYTNIYLSTILYKRKQVCFAKVLLSIATISLLSSLLHSLWFLLWI